MNTTVEEIKSHVDIVEIIGSVAQLQRAGRNFKARCPFHQENTPSFVVSPDRQRWRCYGACQEGGDVISFLMKWENITFMEAMLELSKKTGISFSPSGIEDGLWDRKKRLFAINDYAARVFSYLLHEKPVGKVALSYIEKRGLPIELIKKFNIGFAPDQTPLHPLLLKKWDEQDIIATGLCGSRGPRSLYDRFRSRLMFPLYDVRGNIVGFSGRLIGEDDRQAKYINTPETELYRKREQVYGLYQAKESILQQKEVVIVEGEFDLLSCVHHGIGNAVAIKGSAFTKEQLRLLKRFTSHVITALDQDNSGYETTKRAFFEIEREEMTHAVCLYTNGKDPDEALHDNPITFKKALEHPTSIFDAILTHAQTRIDVTSERGIRALSQEMMPFLAQIENPILADHYKKKLADVLSVSVESIHQSVIAFSQKRLKERIAIVKTEPGSAEEEGERFICAYVFQHKRPHEAKGELFEAIDEPIIKTPAYLELLEHIEAYMGSHETYVMTDFASTLPSPLREVLDIVAMLEIPDDQADAFHHARKIVVKRYISALRDKLRVSIKNHASEDIASLTMKIAQVEKEQAL
jgi:DNA primase